MQSSYLLIAAAVFAVGGIWSLVVYREASCLVFALIFLLMYCAVKLAARVIG